MAHPSECQTIVWELMLSSRGAGSAQQHRIRGAHRSTMLVNICRVLGRAKLGPVEMHMPNAQIGIVASIVRICLKIIEVAHLPLPRVLATIQSHCGPHQTAAPRSQGGSRIPVRSIVIHEKVGVVACPCTTIWAAAHLPHQYQHLFLSSSLWLSLACICLADHQLTQHLLWTIH